MKVDGVITTLSARLDTGFTTASKPPTTPQLIEAIDTRPSAAFQRDFQASAFTPDYTKKVDLLA